MLPEPVAALVHGPLAAGPWPLLCRARLCDLRPRFLPKGCAGRGHRAIARNGRVLLVSRCPLDELTGRPARVRLQTWNRAILRDDVPAPYGVLLCLEALPASAAEPQHAARLVRCPGTAFDLAVDVGGGLFLEFRRHAW